jgi:Ca2+-binding RTX toxin-like protein
MNADGTGRHPVLALARFAAQSQPDWRPECSVKPHRANGGWEIDGTDEADLICADARSMTIYGNGGDDSIYAGDGNDIVYAGPGNDIVLGGDGNDVLKGGSGSDYLEADAGSDRLFGGPGNDSNNAGDGSDHLFDRGKHSGDDGLFAGAGMDVCVGDRRPIDAYAQCETMYTRQRG